MTRSLHCVISGKVQGVGFRYFTKLAADSLGVVGTVRNLENGNVEIYAAAAPESIDEFISRLGFGPPMAIVTELTMVECDPIQKKSFEILH